MIIIPHSSPSPHALSRNPVPTLGVAVEDYLLSEIVEGRLEPGTPLKEVPLAERLNLSSTPIRDALSKLAQTGLVDIISNKSKRVSSLDAIRFLDIMRARHLLAAWAWENAANHFEGEAIGQLKYQIETFNQCMLNANRRGAIEAIFRFDRIMSSISGSKEIDRMIKSREDYIKRHMFLCFPRWPGRNLVDVLEFCLHLSEVKDYDALEAQRRLIWLM